MFLPWRVLLKPVEVRHSRVHSIFLRIKPLTRPKEVTNVRDEMTGKRPKMRNEPTMEHDRSQMVTPDLDISLNPVALRSMRNKRETISPYHCSSFRELIG